MLKLHTADLLDLGEFLDSLSYLCGAPKDEKQRKVPPQCVDRQTKTTQTEWAIRSQTASQTLPRRTIFCLDGIVVKEFP